MQTLIYKTELVVTRVPAWLSPNDPVQVSLSADQTAAVYARPPRRWTSLLTGLRPVLIGTLDEEVAQLILPVLHSGAPLRIRVVGITPAYLSSSNQAQIAVSVWADARDMAWASTAPQIRRLSAAV